MHIAHDVHTLLVLYARIPHSLPKPGPQPAGRRGACARPPPAGPARKRDVLAKHNHNQRNTDTHSTAGCAPAAAPKTHTRTDALSQVTVGITQALPATPWARAGPQGAGRRMAAGRAARAYGKGVREKQQTKEQKGKAVVGKCFQRAALFGKCTHTTSQVLLLLVKEAPHLAAPQRPFGGKRFGLGLQQVRSLWNLAQNPATCAGSVYKPGSRAPLRRPPQPHARGTFPTVFTPHTQNAEARCHVLTFSRVQGFICSSAPA